MTVQDPSIPSHGRMAFGLFRLDHRLRLLDRKSEPEHGTATATFFNPDAPPMSFDDASANREAKPHSTFTGRTGAIELIEDAPFIAGWNPGPSIGNLKNQFMTGHRCRQIYGRRRGRILQGILKQV